MVEYKRKETGKVDRFIEFYSLCEEVKKELLKEKEFIAEYNKWMLSHSYTDENYNLLTQDFIYAVARYFNNNTYTKSDKKKPIASNSPKVIEASQFSHVNESFSGEFKAVKGVDYAKKDEIFRGIGLLGEEWAVIYEKERLSKLGISHSVIHTSIEEGDGKGYDIESVEVLKTGTAIYGAKAANGVIRIKTKRCHSMATRIDVNINAGLEFRPKKFELMNAGQYRSFASNLLQTTNTTLTEFKFRREVSIEKQHHFALVEHLQESQRNGTDK